MEFKPPRGMSFSGDISNNWKTFMQKFNIFLEANEYLKKADNVKIAMFLNCIGDEGLHIFNTFQLTDEDKKSYDTIIKSFKDYCSPRKSTVLNRYKFFIRSQQEGETFDQFQTALKSLAQDCDFGNQMDSLIRDKIIMGLKNTTLQERLLRETEISLETTIKQCRAHKASHLEAQSIQQPHAMVNYVKNKAVTGNTSALNTANTKGKFKCRNCSLTHSKNECPAYGKACLACNKLNHFANSCRSKNQNKKSRPTVKQSTHKINEIETRDTCLSLQEDILFIDHIENKTAEKSWFHKLEINGVSINFKLDTGADINVLPMKYFEQVFRDIELEPLNSTVIAYGGFQLNAKGTLNVKCTPENREPVFIKFVVVETNCIPILSLNTCVQLNLISRINEVQNEKDSFIRQNAVIFEGLGKFPFEYRIRLKEGSVPVVKPVRRIPETIKSKLKDALNTMEKMEIIARVTEPTEWVNDLVIVEKKNGSIRICLSPLELNKWIKREHFHIPTLEDLTANLAGKKLFTVMDLKDGFYQIPLDSSSTSLCTFNMPFGRYKFRRLPFGLCSSPEVFQRENMKIFGDIEGVQVYFDDLIIAAATEEEHEQILSKVVKKAIECSVKFNAAKVQYKVSSVKYLGFIFSAKGLQPDAKQVEAIQNVPEPQDKKSLQQFLGMVTYLYKFIPNMSTIAAPLRELLKKIRSGNGLLLNKIHFKN